MIVEPTRTRQTGDDANRNRDMRISRPLSESSPKSYNLAVDGVVDYPLDLE